MATARMTLFKPIFIDQRIALTPSEFSEAAPDIDSYLVAKIRKDLEGQCCTHGYVRPGSTQILARSMGQGEHGRFTGDFLYTCKVKIMCLLPVADQIVEARILKMNKLGGYALIVDEGRLREAMRVLLPRDLHLGNSDFDALVEGKGVRVRLMKSRFQSKDAFISSIGVFEGLAPGADVDAAVEEEVTLQPAVADTEPVAKRKKKVAETQAAQNITQTAAYDAPPIVTKKKTAQNRLTAPPIVAAAPVVEEAEPVMAAVAAAAAAPVVAAAPAAPVVAAAPSDEEAEPAAAPAVAAAPVVAAAPSDEEAAPVVEAEPVVAAEPVVVEPVVEAEPVEAAAPVAEEAPPAPSLLQSVSNAFASFQQSAEEAGLAPKDKNSEE